MFGGLAEQELKDRNENLGLFRVELLISAQFRDLFAVVWLSCDLSDELHQDQFQLDCRYAVQQGDLSQHPLRAVNVTAELKSHFF